MSEKKPTPIPENMPIQNTPFGLHIATHIQECNTFVNSLKSFYGLTDETLKGFFKDIPEEIEHHRNVHNHVYYIIHHLPDMQYEIRREFYSARAELYQARRERGAS